MAGEELIERAQRGYEAFSSGDIDTVMSLLDDDIEWITPGNSLISGTAHGKQEVGALFGKLAEQGFSSSPQHWFSDGERVVVLTQISVAGESYDAADVLTFRDEKVVKFQSAGDTAAMERAFGSR